MLPTMQSSLFTEHVGDEGLPVTCNVNIVIAFEDAATAKHAEQFYERLKERLGGEFEFTRYQWSFALLQDAAVRDAAAQDAAQADIVIIATHGDLELPEHVDNWFQAWVGRNASPMALVALFDRPAESTEAREDVRAALSRIAQTGGMDFFAEPEHGATEFVNRLTGKL
jgi:hypothetical protein